MKAQKAKTREEYKREHIEEVAIQVAMALESDETSQGVKDCLKTIIMEASNENGMMLSDMRLVRHALPGIIDDLGEDYGMAILSSIAAIIRYDTKVYQTYYEKRYDEKPPEDLQGLSVLADQISEIMKNPLLPTNLYNVMADELSETYVDTDTPENILLNLKSQLKTEKESKVAEAKNES